MTHISVKFTEIQTDCLTMYFSAWYYSIQAFKDRMCKHICANDRGSTHRISEKEMAAWNEHETGSDSY